MNLVFNIRLCIYPQIRFPTMSSPEVKPVKEGYKEFSITPVLGGLKWMEGSVPTPNGNIHIHMDRKMIKVRATEGKGYLTIKSCRQPKANIGTVEKIDENTWRLWIDTPEERIVSGLKY